MVWIKSMCKTLTLLYTSQLEKGVFLLVIWNTDWVISKKSDILLSIREINLFVAHLNNWNTLSWIKMVTDLLCWLYINCLLYILIVFHLLKQYYFSAQVYKVLQGIITKLQYDLNWSYATLSWEPLYITCNTQYLD